MIDQLGTAADGNDITQFRDNWQFRDGRWHVVEERILDFHRTAKATPSDAMRAANALIRQNTQNSMEFNASVTFSECMDSAAMQRYNVDDRKERCRR